MKFHDAYYWVASFHFVISMVPILSICALGILFFWKLRHLRKPILAWIFWALAFGYSLSVLWRTIVLAYAAPDLITIGLGAVSVMILTLYVAGIFYTPWPPREIEGDFDDDDDAPYKVPDEV